MKKRHMDAMALVQTYGKPDIFLTMTCNPNWQEILDELLPGQTPQDRPDLVARVFRAKLETMKDMLTKNHILGVVKAYVYVVEFQKRGLPHAHFLLIMDSTYKLVVPEQYDRVISAELPDKHKYPELYAMVVKHMMHGPCGVLKPNNVCMQDAKVRGQMLDNRWVVPYNPYLLRMFNCHINVEVCSSIKAVKYLYKYIYKGHDQTSFNIDQPDANGNIDEIKRFIDARWITPPEAMWRIFGFTLCENHPAVLQLQLHMPNMHMVTFKAGESLDDVLARDNASKSMLTEYFAANREHEWARDILYKDFPGWFTWQQTKYWKPREKSFQVGRIVSANPAEGERYFLRVLLNHGLIEADNTLDECLTESEAMGHAASARRLFATILVFCEPGDVRGLWDRHVEAMSMTSRRRLMCPIAVEREVLLDIGGIFGVHG
ncbi:uncharacterized protein [Lolium perenne]|uniref:uncharacterized protein n=1 Tax=Lolium perenne TaxID=4522 RepID=UPI003A991A26